MKKSLKGLVILLIVILFAFSFLAMSKEYAKSYVRQSVKEEIIKESDSEDMTYEVPAGNFLAITGEEDGGDDGVLDSWIRIAGYVSGNTGKTEKLHMIGRLKIPSLGIDEPVWKENSALAMRYGVILMDDKAGLGSEGNAVIVGHRNTVTHTVFDKLPKIKKGETAIVITPDGEEQRYRVNGTYYCSPYELQNYVGSSSEYPVMITLVTCAREKGNSWRFIATLIPE